MMKIKDKDKILKATREKWQMSYKGTPIRLSADFQQKLYKPEKNGMIYLKWWKGRNYNQEYSTQQNSRSDLMEKSKAFQASKFKRIQHHQTIFMTNNKETSLGGKHKWRKRPTQNNPQIVNKMVIGSYISIIALNVNGLNTPTKAIDWLCGWEHSHVCASTYHITVLNSLNCMYYFMLLG